MIGCLEHLHEWHLGCTNVNIMFSFTHAAWMISTSVILPCLRECLVGHWRPGSIQLLFFVRCHQAQAISQATIHACKLRDRPGKSCRLTKNIRFSAQNGSIPEGIHDKPYRLHVQAFAVCQAGSQQRFSPLARLQYTRSCSIQDRVCPDYACVA